jgi:hypothetical protein
MAAKVVEAEQYDRIAEQERNEKIIWFRSIVGTNEKYPDNRHFPKQLSGLDEIDDIPDFIMIEGLCKRGHLPSALSNFPEKISVAMGFQPLGEIGSILLQFCYLHRQTSPIPAMAGGTVIEEQLLAPCR